jgi:hypothetical protein
MPPAGYLLHASFQAFITVYYCYASASLLYIFLRVSAAKQLVVEDLSTVQVRFSFQTDKASVNEVLLFVTGDYCISRW